MKFKEALYYKKLNNKKVHCNLCPHSCIIENGEAGKCEIRQNINGRLKNMNYGKLLSVEKSPVEKFLYHFMPGQKVLDLKLSGSNISFGKNEEKPEVIRTPGQIAGEAKKSQVKIIAYSKGEPAINYEFVKETSSKSNVMNIITSKGFVNDGPVIGISKNITAALIELNSINEEVYEEVYGAKLEPILKVIQLLKQENVWIEISVPIIAGVNNSIYDIQKIVSWILANLGSKTPLHLYPASEHIDMEIVKKARKTAIEAGLEYVYINQQGGSDTYCPNCKKPVIIRNSNEIKINLIEGRCKCGHIIPGIFGSL